MIPESVFECVRNGWSDGAGISGRMRPEWVVESRRNTHNGLFGYDVNVPGNQAIVSALRQVIGQLVGQGYDRFITGGALGVDQWAASAVVEAKAYYPQLQVVIAIPFNGFEAKWPERSQQLFAELVQYASELYAISPPGYDPAKMQARNIWMVEQSELVVAAWNGKPGGTANCVAYAERQHKPLVRINPQTGQITWPS